MNLLTTMKLHLANINVINKPATPPEKFKSSKPNLQLQPKKSVEQNYAELYGQSIRGSSSKHQSRYDNSFTALGPKLWNAMLNHLSADFPAFKNLLTAFLLTVPDKPSVRGYVTPNTNSLLAWRVDTSAFALWGGQRI